MKKDPWWFALVIFVLGDLLRPFKTADATCKFLSCFNNLFTYYFNTGNFTVPPSNITASPCASVNFTCEAIGMRLYWTVRGDSLHTNCTIKQQREISVTTKNISVMWSSVLTIRALPINNGITVGCAVLCEPLCHNSLSGYLTIEGTVSSCNPTSFIKIISF